MDQDQNKRKIDLNGTYNFREMGGYKTSSNKETKWGIIYRSDELSRLSKEDLEILKNFNIKTIIDFRSNEEIEFSPDKKPETVTKSYKIPIEFGSMASLAEKIEASGEELMMQINRSAIDDAQEQYRNFFKIISNPSNLPLIFHCAGGKDRTGVAAALFLASLDVDIETIYNDYLLTGELIQKKYSEMLNANPQLAPGFTVKKKYIEAAFDLINKKYGGIENYLTKQLGVDIELMKSIYIE